MRAGVSTGVAPSPPSHASAGRDASAGRGTSSRRACADECGGSGVSESAFVGFEDVPGGSNGNQSSPSARPETVSSAVSPQIIDLETWNTGLAARPTRRISPRYLRAWREMKIGLSGNHIAYVP